jgi:hypothetical protein
MITLSPIAASEFTTAPAITTVPAPSVAPRPTLGLRVHRARELEARLAQALRDARADRIITDRHQHLRSLAFHTREKLLRRTLHPVAEEKLALQRGVVVDEVRDTVAALFLDDVDDHLRVAARAKEDKEFLASHACSR